jgi:hypothetical protein
MAESEKVATGKTMPRGVRKGGARFPKIDLKQALNYSKKLVAKTHTGPQAASIVLPGVFANAGSPGEVRASALKQYGLLEGGSDAYKATQLAKDIDAALEEDKQPLLQRAFLNSKPFDQIFQTFRGDTVSKAKIEQRAKGLEVHPELAEECARIFVDSAVTAGLGTLSADMLTLLSSATASPNTGSDDKYEQGRGEEDLTEELGTNNKGDAKDAAIDEGSANKSDSAIPQNNRPGVMLNLNVDSSSDPDKLEKQLVLLRRFGIV